MRISISVSMPFNPNDWGQIEYLDGKGHSNNTQVLIVVFRENPIKDF
jgi:hypothetical protein